MHRKSQLREKTLLSTANATYSQMRFGGRRNVGLKSTITHFTHTPMKINWSIVAAGVIAGLVMLVIQEYGFKRTVDAKTGAIESKPVFMA